MRRSIHKILHSTLDRIGGNFFFLSPALLLIAAMLVWLMNRDIYFGVGFLGIVSCIGTVLLIYRNPVQAIVLSITAAFFLNFVFFRLLKIHDAPIAFVIDGLVFLALLTLIIRGEFNFEKRRIAILLLCWLALCMLEIANPMAASRAAWFRALRDVIGLTLPFFIIFSIFKNRPGSLKVLLNTWIFICALTALYTLIQEFLGYPPWDYAFIIKDEEHFRLLFTWGRLRKISFFTGPMENGVVMALNAVLCIGLAFRAGIRKREKLLLLVVAVLSAWAMLYTGTRTASIIFAMGMFVYVLLSRRKELIIYASIVVFILMPYVIIKGGGGAAVQIMSTAFSPMEDPSMQVRLDNQKLVQTYIVKAPFGYGMGSTGYLGRKFSPDTFLGSFPPDSELVRIAIETGFLGLAFWLLFQFLIINKSLDLVMVNDSRFLENFRLVAVAMLFMILLGQYPQEILKFPSIRLIFSILIAFISLTPEEQRVQWDTK